MSTPALLRLDDDDPCLDGYAAVRYPDGWEVVVAARVPLGRVYNEVFDRSLDWYGLFADDVMPETHGWDRLLIDAAGSDGMAVPSGGHDDNGTPHFVLGGALVREIGWLALPGLDRLFIDTCWADIARSRGVLRRVPEVVLRHHHFSTRLALFDKTYRKLRKTEDRAVYEAWRKRKDIE